ncbi:deoxyribonuclease IV [Phytomonospora endophytica]|uniref:Deoxyribonuclease-4 n=1 Tax=Phytomonospora endophytica TaxID=714109 RepID=A0A841FV42_9ACTN|nr:deoxyribonuclease IV [Phytomonospora endophytica]MBB6039876.1 deoxyribonuclease-4 [Phytomonospora endophytica]GIG71054.1 deoxyribonuclease IV [Phytomonospora endophytica]
MRIGAHVDDVDPLAEAAEREADLVQFFLADPQGWKAPAKREDAQAISDSDVDVFIHAPYVINLASLNNRIRVPSRRLLLQHAKAAATVGAKGLIVHGGHVRDGEDIATGFDNWRKAFAYAEKEGGLPTPVLIENTAGGEHACARRYEMIARLWDAIGEYEPGFCLDTCHAHAGGLDLTDVVDKIKAITGRIDLVHANDSMDGFDSGRDRHANVGHGEIGAEAIAHVIREADCPAVVETKGGAAKQAEDIQTLRELLK